MKADTKTESAVMEVLNQFNQYYMYKDIDGIMGLFAPEHDIVFLGTGSDEKRIGPNEIRKQLQRDFEQSEELKWEWQWISVSVFEKVSWVAADFVVVAKVDGKSLNIPGRVTCVLENLNSKWRIVQWHNSLPSAAQEEGKAFPKN
ncbi:MAG: nuclear transport factor 2 family protein [Pseudomonadota bacterium]